MMFNKSETIDISVILITYNQEQYITDALDSILIQKTSYSVEVLVGEDCSPDGTKDKLKKYEADHPGCLKVIYNEKNLGATRNLYQLLEIARGRYIALLEGDDYWLGEDRLQTLCSFLDSHPECAAVSHKRERRAADGKLLGYDPDDKVINTYLDIKAVNKGNLFSVMGCMFRNFFKEPAKDYKTALTAARNACDCVLMYIILNNGSVYILDRCFGVYRVLTGAGNSNYCSVAGQLKVDKDLIAQYSIIATLYGNRGYIKKKIAYKAFDAVMFCTKRKMKAERKEILKSLTAEEKRWCAYRFLGNLLQRITCKMKAAIKKKR